MIRNGAYLATKRKWLSTALQDSAVRKYLEAQRPGIELQLSWCQNRGPINTPESILQRELAKLGEGILGWIRRERAQYSSYAFRTHRDYSCSTPPVPPALHAELELLMRERFSEAYGSNESAIRATEERATLLRAFGSYAFDELDEVQPELRGRDLVRGLHDLAQLPTVEFDALLDHVQSAAGPGAQAPNEANLRERIDSFQAVDRPEGGYEVTGLELRVSNELQRPLPLSQLHIDSYEHLLEEQDNDPARLLRDLATLFGRHSERFLSAGGVLQAMMVTVALPDHHFLAAQGLIKDLAKSA